MTQRTRPRRSRPAREARRPREDREVRRARKREEMLDAAVAVLRREGPAASMDRIAREAGVTKPIVYRAFGDRDGLAVALGERISAELAEALTSALVGAGSDRERVSAAIDVYLALVERDPAVMRFLIHRSLTDDGHSGVAASAFVSRLTAIVAQAVGEALRGRGGDRGAAEPWAFAVIGAVHLAGDWWSERRTMSRAHLVEYLTELFYDGMGARA